jgi:hypothetical protein
LVPHNTFDLLEEACHHNVYFDSPIRSTEELIQRVLSLDFVRHYTAFPDLIRRSGIFMSSYRFDGTTCVYSTGAFIGTSANNWLDIPAAGSSIGWLSIYTIHIDTYLGVMGTAKSITMRVMDWWSCNENLLLEIWVFN